jgi:membrane protease YdiL (CAAX protease family)
LVTIGVHFANNIIGILVINRAGSAVTTPALFTISEFHATYVALSVLVAIPVFLAIAYKCSNATRHPNLFSRAIERVVGDLISSQKHRQMNQELIIMSQLPSNHPRESRKNTASSSRPNKAPRPGLPECIVGLVVLFVVGFVGGSQLPRLGLDPVVYGLVFTALSGIAGIAGFSAAVLLRIRSLRPFGVRRTSRRWLLIGVGVGLVAFVLKGLAILVWIQIAGDTENIQDTYAQGGSDGVLSLVLATVFLGFVTPLGEEFLFRGVITNALLRYGAVFGVVCLDLRSRPRHQYRLSCGCSGRSCHRRNLPPQRIVLDCCCRSRRFQLAHNPGDGARWHGLIGRI